MVLRLLVLVLRCSVFSFQGTISGYYSKYSTVKLLCQANFENCIGGQGTTNSDRAARAPPTTTARAAARPLSRRVLFSHNRTPAPWFWHFCRHARTDAGKALHLPPPSKTTSNHTPSQHDFQSTMPAFTGLFSHHLLPVNTEAAVYLIPILSRNAIRAISQNATKQDTRYAQTIFQLSFYYSQFINIILKVFLDFSALLWYNAHDPNFEIYSGATIRIASFWKYQYNFKMY